MKGGLKDNRVCGHMNKYIEDNLEDELLTTWLLDPDPNRMIVGKIVGSQVGL